MIELPCDNFFAGKTTEKQALRQQISNEFDRYCDWKEVITAQGLGYVFMNLCYFFKSIDRTEMREKLSDDDYTQACKSLSDYCDELLKEKLFHLYQEPSIKEIIDRDWQGLAPRLKAFIDSNCQNLFQYFALINEMASNDESIIKNALFYLTEYKGRELLK